MKQQVKVSPQVSEPMRKSLKRLAKRMQPDENRLSMLLDEGSVAGVVTERSKLVASMSDDMRQRIKGILRSGSDAGVICKPGFDNDNVHFDYVVVSDRAVRDDVRLDIALHNAGRLLENLQKPEKVAQRTFDALRRANSATATPTGIPNVQIEGLSNIDDLELEIQDVTGDLQKFQNRLNDLCSGGIGVPGPSGRFELLRKISDREQDFLEQIYGDGVNYNRIRLSPLHGLGGSPFTLAIDPGLLPIEVLGSLDPDVPLLEFGLTIIFLGEKAYAHSLEVIQTPSGKAPAGSILAHEVAHSWQSQHHIDGSFYMWNAILSQALAILMGDPFFAYGYKPHQKLRKYAAEQAACNVSVHINSGNTGGCENENGDRLIVSKVPPSLTGVWKFCGPNWFNATLIQDGTKLRGYGDEGIVSKGSSGHFVIENGTVNGTKIHFTKRYTNQSRQPIDYSGEFAFHFAPYYKGWMIEGNQPELSWLAFRTDK